MNPGEIKNKPQKRTKLLGFKCFKIIIHKQIALEQCCPVFYDVTSRTLRLRAAASLLTGERRNCGHSLLARPLPRTHAHNKKITTARFPSQLEGKITRFPQQISPNECFIIRVKHGRGRTWLLRPLSPGLINHAITETSPDWRGAPSAIRIQFFFPPFVEISFGRIKWANPLGGCLCVIFCCSRRSKSGRKHQLSRKGSFTE